MPKPVRHDKDKRSFVSLRMTETNMKFIDTHAHFDFSHYDADRNEVIARAREVCEAVITIGVDIETSRKALLLAQENDFVWTAVGVHPHETDVDITGVMAQLKELVGNDKVVAVGETGLDYKTDPVHGDVTINKEKQQALLKAHIELANEMGKPVIVHARDCWEDLVSLLKEAKPKAGVIHSWTGDTDQAKEILDLGLYISFSGMLTYPRNEYIREVAREIPLERVVLETDAPFLPPQPVRGQRNEPAYVKMTAEKLAEVRGMGLEEVATVTTENAKRLFGI